MHKTALEHLEAQIDELNIACTKKCNELFKTKDGDDRETLDAKQWEKILCHSDEYLIHSVEVVSVYKCTDTNAPYMYLKVTFENNTWRGVRVYLPDAVEV